MLGGVATKENDVVIKAPLGSITNTSGKDGAIEQGGQSDFGSIGIDRYCYISYIY